MRPRVIIPALTFILSLANALCCTSFRAESANPAANGGVDAADGGADAADGACVTCAACGKDCLGGACVDAACQPVVLADNQAGPTALVVHGEHVFWANTAEWGQANPGSGSLGWAKKDGTERKIVDGIGSPIDLVVDEKYVYVTGVGGEGPIRKVDRQTGLHTNLTPPPVVGGHHSMVLRDGMLTYVSPTEGAIFRVAVTFGAQRTLVVLDPALKASGSRDLALDDGGIWYAPQSTPPGATNRVLPSGCPDGGACLIKLMDRARPFAIDESFIYYGSDPLLELKRADRLNIANPVDLLSGLGDIVREVALDGEWVYVLTGTEDAKPPRSRIIKVRKDGNGPATVLVTSNPLIWSIALDERALYYAVPGPEWTSGGAIVKIAK